MAKGVEISNNERIFVLELLKQGLRADGRKIDEIREPIIKLSPNEFGYVEVDWGQTKLSVRVSATIVKPYDDRPFEGIFTINTEISPMASPQFEHGRNSDQEVLISRLIEKAIRRSNALDLESLCIVSGSKVWQVKADINFLNYDGGLIDASSVGVMAALQYFRKPEVTVNGEDFIVHSMEDRNPVPLSILHVPISVTYSFFSVTQIEEIIKGNQDSEISIMDATQQEELISGGTLVVTLNKNRELIQLSKSGGLPVNVLLLMELSQRAYAITERFTNKIKEVLQRDEKERYERTSMKFLEAGSSR